MEVGGIEGKQFVGIANLGAGKDERIIDGPPEIRRFAAF